MKSNLEVGIRCAKEEDIPGILLLQKAFLLSAKNINNAEKRGFLIYPLTEDELKIIITNKNNLLLVALKEEQLAGYALAYDLNEWKRVKTLWDEQIHTDLKTKELLSKVKILYFRHIVRRDDYPSVGMQLEEKVYQFARSKGYKWVIGEILEQPIANWVSKKVHEERGYARIGQIKYPDRYLWGVYKKELI